MPGTYSVALMVDGKTVETKPIKIVMDPAVPLTGVARASYNVVTMDLHTLQKRGTETANALTTLYGEVTKAASKMDSSAAPDADKARFVAFRKEFDTIRAKFGAPLGGASNLAAFAAGAALPGGRGGGAADNANVLARVGTVKGAIMGTWETPSAALMKQVAEVKTALPAAIAEANTFLAKARTVSQAIAKYNVTMLVPAAPR